MTTLRSKFIGRKFKKSDISQINNLIVHLKVLEKQKQTQNYHKEINYKNRGFENGSEFRSPEPMEKQAWCMHL